MEIKRETSYTKNLKCQDVYTESSADYILPDYLGDVRKILFTEATLRPSGRFAGGDDVEFSGVVVYSVIYLDSEGELSSAEFTSDYDYSVACNGESYRDSVSETRISGYSVRSMGPRKLSARANLVGSVRVSEVGTLEIAGDVFEGDSSPELNTKLVKIRKGYTSAVCEREYAEQLCQLDGAMADEVRVIYSSAENKLESVEMEDGGARVRGKLKLYAVICRGDEPAYGLEKQLSIDELVPFDEVGENMKLIPEVNISSLRVNVNPNELGCEVVASAIAEICVLAESNEPLELTLDGYLKTCPTENSYEDFHFETFCDLLTSSHPHSAELNKAEGELMCATDLVFVTATPKVERVECTPEGVRVIGEVRYSGIVSENNDDTTTYSGLKFSSPFDINVKHGCQNSEKTIVSAKVVATNAGANIDENSINLCSTLEVIITLCQEGCERVLVSSSKSEGEAYEKTGGVITVYYPNDGDTLFSVAKRFHTSGLKIARDNDISDQVFARENESGSLRGIKKLLIY